VPTKIKNGLKVTKCIFVLEKSVTTIIFITRMNIKICWQKHDYFNSACLQKYMQIIELCMFTRIFANN